MPSVVAETASHRLWTPEDIRQVNDIPLLTEAYLGYTLLQSNVLLLAAHGGRAEDVSARLSHSSKDITAVGISIAAMHNVPNMAAAVHQAIVEETLDLSEEPRVGLEIGLSERELITLGLISRGRNNGEIAGVFGKNKGTFVKNIGTPLFKKLHANGRTHSVLRGHVEGILKS